MSGLLGQIFRTASKKVVNNHLTEELWNALHEGDRSKVHQLLVLTPSLVNCSLIPGRCPLHFAAETKNTSLALLLLEHSANVNEVDDRVWHPLHFAAYTKNEKLLMMLLMQPNINVSLTTLDGSSTLHYLARYCLQPYIDVCKWLLLRGADINAINKNKETPLHYAVMHRNLAMVQLLIKLGASVNAVNKYNDTPLKLAVYTENPDIIQCLLKANARVDVGYDEGESIYSICRTPEFRNIVASAVSNPDSIVVSKKLPERGLHEVSRRYELVFYEEDETDESKTKPIHILNDNNWAEFSGQNEHSPLFISLSRLFHWYNILNDPGNANSTKFADRQALSMGGGFQRTNDGRVPRRGQFWRSVRGGLEGSESRGEEKPQQTRHTS
eukprot:TRINITY_DN2122_c0_g1_i2.p1 TRINITY_DN2122_c0_g1~~TRINITY_DN2122_c0_g1_i2.p1  ORF type:complete len:384 (-),score=82.63 TRINITY_DN2122_c0_g1_i2:838-1989(-)